MPVTVVVGGQFGSEGKGKVAHFLAAEAKATLAVRVGGPNSGHTVVGPDGSPVVFRHLPTPCLLPGVRSVIPPGSYLSLPILEREISRTRLDPNRLAIDPDAWLVTPEDATAERDLNLPGMIGSTGSGTGAAVIRRIWRNQPGTFAKKVPVLAPFLADTADVLSKALAKGARVIVEGTQGFGLSLLHSRQYPNCTSRDTTASAFIAEAGLSPLDVDHVVLVIRAHPIRVAGQSGPLADEIDWKTVTQESGSPEPLVELTTVTQKTRRIARFHVDVVRRAIAHNRPTSIVLNHLDYVDFRCRIDMRPTKRALAFVEAVENGIEQYVDLVGFGPAALRWRDTARKRAVT